MSPAPTRTVRAGPPVVPGEDCGRGGAGPARSRAPTVPRLAPWRRARSHRRARRTVAPTAATRRTTTSARMAIPARPSSRRPSCRCSATSRSRVATAPVPPCRPRFSGESHRPGVSCDPWTCSTPTPPTPPHRTLPSSPASSRHLLPGSTFRCPSDPPTARARAAGLAVRPRRQPPLRRPRLDRHRRGAPRHPARERAGSHCARTGRPSNTGSGDATDGDITDVVAAARESVVTITADGVTSSGFSPFQVPTSGVGSGVILTSSGYILTNRHVVEDSQSLTVAFSDGTRARRRGSSGSPTTPTSR